MLDEHFNKMIANIDQNIAQMQTQSKTSKVTKNQMCIKNLVL